MAPPPAGYPPSAGGGGGAAAGGAPPMAMPPPAAAAGGWPPRPMMGGPPPMGYPPMGFPPGPGVPPPHMMPGAYGYPPRPPMGTPTKCQCHQPVAHTSSTLTHCAGRPLMAPPRALPPSLPALHMMTDPISAYVGRIPETLSDELIQSMLRVHRHRWQHSASLCTHTCKRTVPELWHCAILEACS